MATGFQPNALQNSAFQTPSLPAFQSNDSQSNAFQTFSLGTSYYWVGGSGTWDATTTTNWALSSGGAGSAGVPTSGDTAIFDTLSNAISYTVTKAAGAVTGDLNASGPLVGSVSFAGVGVSVYGDFTLAATGVTWSAGGITFASTATGKTITTNGVTLAAVTFNGVGGGWTLGSALTCGAVVLTNGTLDTSSQSVQSTSFSSTTGTRVLTLGASTWVVTDSGANAWIAASAVGSYTVNAGTSTVSLTSASAKTFSGGANRTYYNVNQGGAGALTIANNNMTFNDLQNSYVATGATTITQQAATLTVANFTATGAVGKVLTLNSSVAGTARTITKTGGGIISVDYMSIRDSTVTGTGASWYAGANSTNVSNNTGWIFTAPPGGAYVITANNGSYSVTGQASSILVSRLLFGAFGSYTVAGQNASVTYSPGPSPTPAEIQLLIKLRSFTERRRF